MMTHSSPRRTCVSCAVGSDKRALVRFVRTSEGDVHVDSSGKANGRGAYVCPTTECFDNAIVRRRLNSALRVNLREDDTDRLRREFEGALAKRSTSHQGR